MPIDPDLFRSVLGRFASGITVITACDEAGGDHGMTVSAFASLSLKPPMVLACIAHDAKMASVIARADNLVINILSDGQEALSRRFAGKEDDRFSGIGFTRANNGATILDDALAWLECRVVERHLAGDHSIVIAAVESATASERHPLLHYRGGYTRLEH